MKKKYKLYLRPHLDWYVWIYYQWPYLLFTVVKETQNVKYL